MAKEKGEDGFDRVDGHTSRGNAAFCLEDTPQGELIVLKHGPRKMPVLYTHLIPATFGGRARMNVANALAAAAAAWASGAHLHDIRQGLRTFTTSFFQAPGRLNLLEVAGTRVVIDYCHNVDGMRQLSDFVNRMMVEPQTRVRGARGGCRRRRAPRAQRAGDRRHRDPRRPARRRPARVRRPRRRRRSTRSTSARTRTCAAGAPGETATNVAAGVKAAKDEGRGRTTKVEKVLDEAAAVRAALRRAAPGDLVVVCADDAVGVYRRGDDARGPRRGRDGVRRSGRARGAGRLDRARSGDAFERAPAHRLNACRSLPRPARPVERRASNRSVLWPQTVALNGRRARQWCRPPQ